MLYEKVGRVYFGMFADTLICWSHSIICTEFCVKWLYYYRCLKDKDNRKQLDNVNVSVVGTNIGTMTNADGIFSLKVTETGMFDRYVSNIRFKDETLEDVLRVINKESSFWQIETSSPVLNKKKLTVEFFNNSPESVAELVCWTFGLKCIRQGNKLILSQ